jgi:hypothetical protein
MHTTLPFDEMFACTKAFQEIKWTAYQSNVFPAPVL